MHPVPHLPAVERLLARPGAGVADLRTADPAPDRDAADALADEHELHAERAALTAGLARRWGEPRVLDLGPFLARSAAGEPVPEPLPGLCGYVGELAVWTVGGRWIGIGVVPPGETFPARLIAAAGEEGVPLPPDAGRLSR